MNACEKAYLQMNLLLDGQLEPEQAQQLKAHLEHCKNCLETFAQLRAVTCLLREETEPVPETLHTSVMAAVQREREQGSQPSAMKPQKKRIFPKRLVKVLGGIAACAALVLMLRAAFPGSKSADATMDVSNQNGFAMMVGPKENADDALYETSGGAFADGEAPPETPESAPLPNLSAESAEIELPDDTLTKAAAHLYYAEGYREALPAWAEAALSQCVVDNAVYDCVEISVDDAEEQLNDLIRCGFTLEADAENVDTECILVLFCWQEAEGATN